MKRCVGSLLALLLNASLLPGAILDHLAALSPRVKTDHPDLKVTWGHREGPKALATADFDQDGHADFATANLDGSLSVVYGSGNGEFEDPVFVNLGARTLRGLQAVDLNGDGIADFATTDPVAGNLHLVMSHAARGYLPATALAQWRGVRAVVAGHFNTDAHLDLALAGPSIPSEISSTTGLRLLFGDGEGVFSDSEDVENRLQISAWPDLKPVFNLETFREGGAAQDSLVLSQADSGPIWTLHPNAGSPSYLYGSEALRIARTETIIAMKIGGLTTAESRDLVTVSKIGNSIIVYPDNGSSSGSPWVGSVPIKIAVPGSPRSVEIADTNGDGRNDLVVILRNFDRMLVYENRETGFEIVSEVPTGSSPREVLATEWNGDGLPDLLVMNRRSADVSLYTSDEDSDGVGVSNQIYPVDGRVGQVGVEDLNGDGRGDVVQLHVASNELSVRFADEGGLLENPVFYSTGINPISFLLQDLNGDEVIDFAVTNIGNPSGGSSLSIRYGHGDGSFGDEVVIPDTDGRMFAVASGDFDGDAISDLVVGYFDCRIVVYRGRGDGTFERRFVHEFTYESRVMVTADFDQDGDLDLAGVGAGGDLVVLANNGDFMSEAISERYDYKFGEKGSESPNLRLIDRNNDSDPDLLIVVPDGIVTFLGIEGAEFQQEEVLRDGLQTPANSTAFLDIDGDGIEDVAASCQLLSCLSLYRGTTEGDFEFAGTVDVPSVQYLAAGDLDGDGELDLVGTGSSLWTVLSNPPSEEAVQRQIRNSVSRSIAPHPVINEVLAANDEISIPGSEGFPDAIEIFHGGSSPMLLSGMSLNLIKDDEVLSYQIPEGVEVGSGERLVLICDEGEEVLFTGFKIPKEGATLTLVSALGDLIDSVSYPELESNTSYGRYQDGFRNFVVNSDPDIGATNLDNGIVDPDLKFETFLPEMTAEGERLYVLATAQDDIGVFSLTLHYRRLDTEDMEEKSILLFDDGRHSDGGVGDGLYGNVFPESFPEDALIEFFFTAVDLTGGQTSKPGASGFGAIDQPTDHHVIRLGNFDSSFALQISEVVSKNKTGLTEVNGKTVDWIEVRNVSDSPISLANLELSNQILVDPDERYQFPEGLVLGGGEYLIVFADNDPEDGPMHAPFRIDSDGDRLALQRRGEDGFGTILSVIEVPRLHSDTSWSQLGTEGHTLIGSPTPGRQNGPSRLTLIPDGLGYVVVFPTEEGVPFSLMESPDLKGENASVILEGNGTNIEQLVSGTWMDRTFYWLRHGIE